MNALKPFGSADMRKTPNKGGSIGRIIAWEAAFWPSLSGIGGGAFIGWVIDQFAGTSPWGLLVVMALGVVAAFRNIIRISGSSQG
jgi:ATP synthase protein I